jgi:CheY-like chemotaxis protein
MQQAWNTVLDSSASVLQQPCRALKLRILVIDDEQSVRHGMLHLLQDWGCDCKTAEGIEEALSIVPQWLPEVIISDYRLREQRTGSEAITALRERLQYSVPALLITGDTAPQRLREAQESGVPLLHKPVSPDQLYHQLLHITQNGAGCSRSAAS